MPAMGDPIDLLDHPTYAIPQVDRLLALKPGTARRWIDGYTRAGKFYKPVIRAETTGDEIVTWGEFVETRLLAEYRDKGVPLLRMRPAIEKLREVFGTQYPLAHAMPYAEGKELVVTVQDEVHLAKALLLVVIRNGQYMLTGPANQFVGSVEFAASPTDDVVARLHPLSGDRRVVVDPLRQFGEPVVRSVPTEVIAEQVRAGDRLEMIAELYELTLGEVEAAVRYELMRVSAAAVESAA